MKKLLASDLDGTLIFENKLPEKNKRAVLSLNKGENIFVVSTGRPYNGVTFLEDDHNIKIDYYVLLNGAMILDGEKNTIKHEIIDKELVKEIIQEHYKEGMAISVESGYCTYILTKEDKLPYPNRKRVNSVAEIKEEISLISMHMPEYEFCKIDEIKDKINNLYGDIVIAYRNSNYIDVVPIGCSKGSGVDYVVEKENINKDNVYTIGDSWNDYSMFNITDNSFTFHHAEEELKEHTKYVVESVAECVDKYIILV